MTTTRQPGLVSVARHAGVSVGTVSNTINRPHLVAAETKARVRASIAALGYVPNRAAAALRRGSNPIIGLVIPDVMNAFYAAIVDAVVEAADRHRYAVSLCVSHDDPDRERRHFELLAEQRAAGALVVPVDADRSRLAQLRAFGTRLVLVDRRAEEAEGCSVAVDDVLGGYLAVSHLLQGQGNGVTIVNGHPAIPQCHDRREGARDALVEAGRNPDSLIEFVVATMNFAAGVEVARRIVAQDAPRRIFCINDQLALGVIEGLTAQGLRVPEDASVIGYGDLGLGASSRLSTVGQPKHEMGDEAVRKLLDELMDGESHVHTATVFPPHLIVRGTSSHAHDLTVA
ncbi:LacI family DNA-binding transcriptional regulator [Agromyces agglutinans]|nr:LacI family DNA-binding transcriptional regulator [Agromyces agglutinans]